LQTKEAWPIEVLGGRSLELYGRVALYGVMNDAEAETEDWIVEYRPRARLEVGGSTSPQSLTNENVCANGWFKQHGAVLPTVVLSRLEPADRFVDKRGALALEVEEKPFYPIPSGDLQERETITNPERSLDRAWDGVASEETADLVMRWLSGLERIVGKERQLRVLGRRDTPSLFRFVHLFVPAVQRFNNPRSLAASGAEGAKLI